MSLVLKRRLAVSAAVLTVFGGSAGTALACHGDGAATASQLSFTAFHHEGTWHGTWFGSAVTSYLGLQPAQIKTDLAAGQTLAQIANATPGKSATGLVSTIMVALKSRPMPIGRRVCSSQRQRNARSQKPMSVSATSARKPR